MSHYQDKYDHQAEMLANKVKKKYQHFRKRFARQNIEVFRLYDWDITEIRAVVDWYAGHVVVGEYTRKQSTPDWLPRMGEAVQNALGVSAEKIHLKRRYYGKSEGKRYERLNTTNQTIVVCERDLLFWVNPWDFVDTGLFGDHRDTRQMVREMVTDKEVLNLFCYTGAFTCYAALGGASGTVSVDRSKTAIDWARRNFHLNKLSMTTNRLIRAHVFDFLSQSKNKAQRFDLAVVDPPSFYYRKSKSDHFDIVRDHPFLLQSVAYLMRPGGVILFSTNHQDFKPAMDGLGFTHVDEITETTIPEDYWHKRKTIHRCWRIVV